MNAKAMRTALIFGTVLQLLMVIAGHWIAVIKDQGFMAGGLMISLVAGWLYGRAAGLGWGGSLGGGALAGAVCALIGIAVSVVLGDTAVPILAIGTCSSAVTGLLGGAFGKLTARKA